MKKWIVYRHTSPSGKVYIGLTSQKPYIRWGINGKNYMINSIFIKAIKKYGWDNIIHEILLDGISKEHAIYTEKYLIKWYKIHNISYNITDGGEGMCGFKLSEEVKNKISNKAKGRPSPLKGIKFSEERKLAMSERMKGKYIGHLNPNYGNGDKIKGEKHWNYNKHHSEETKKKIGMANKGKTHVLSEEVKNNMRNKCKNIILQIDINNDNIINEFPNAMVAARLYNKGKSIASHIIECCKGKRNKVLNFKWRYKNGSTIC